MFGSDVRSNVWLAPTHLKSHSKARFPCFLNISIHSICIEMGGKLNSDQLQDLNIKLAQGMPHREIQRLTRIATTTIRRIVLSYEFYRKPYPPSTVHVGRQKTLIQYQANVSECKPCSTYSAANLAVCD